ncbi:MAG: type VI secretion system tube protein Hcp [Rheinheimera sp.]|nr:type VI secretion system tube protein Hcp [Rheinheimera sp.]
MISCVARADDISADVSIASTDLTLVSSVRVARTVQQYTISATARNSSSKQYRNVVAQLSSVPDGISIIDGSLNFGDIAAGGAVNSTDVFVIHLNLRATPAPQLSDMQWQLQGDEVVQPPLVTPAQAGIFMKIDDGVIKGDADSASHKDWIALLSWQDSAAVQFSSTPGGTGSGKVSLGDVNVTKLVDAASPLLRAALTKGQLFDEVKIDIINSCHQQFYVQYAISLFNVAFSAMQAGQGSGSLPTEQLGISTTAVETSYTPVGPDCKLQQPVYSFQHIK